MSASDPSPNPHEIPDQVWDDEMAKRPPRHHEWTPAKMVAFLRELAASQSVSHAARSVGMSRQSAYKLRTRLEGTPFAMAWEVALEAGLQQLAHAVMDRALNGVEQPHYYHGKLLGTTRKHDNRLAIWLLDNPWKVGRHQISRESGAADWEGLLDRVDADGNRWRESDALEPLLSVEEREELNDPIKRLEAESWYLANLPRRARG